MQDGSIACTLTSCRRGGIHHNLLDAQNIMDSVMTPTPQDGYTGLLEVWNRARALPKDDGDSLANLGYGFWHAGNTLDTFMDYYQRAQPAGYQKDAVNRTEEAIDIFKTAIEVDPTNPPARPPDVAWWDDYGWWGVAFLKAYGLTNAFRYVQCAKTCWDFMDEGGRHHDDSNPNEKNGTWNHYPTGVQNLITNSLFLNLSAQLYGLSRDQKYLDGACDQFEWFYHWFTQGALCPVTPEGKLVYPSCGIAVSVNDDSIRNDKGHYWTGDQGAVLGALSALLHISDDAAPRIAGPSDLVSYLKDACNSIVEAVTTNQAMVYQNTGVLYEPEWYDLNGAVGKGVLMRYLVAWLQSQDLLSTYKTFVDVNALAATTNPEPDGYFRFSWANVPGRSIQEDGYPILKQLTRQCAGQDAFNASLLVA